MDIKIGDLVRVPLAKGDLLDATKYLYGTVEKYYTNTIVLVRLESSHKGAMNFQCPDYFLKRLTPEEYLFWTTKEEYAKMEVPMVEQKYHNPFSVDGECRHEWIKVGTSPMTNEHWWNCKHCEKAKEEV